MACPPTLQIDYPRLADIAAHPAWWQDVLALIRFDRGSPAAPLADITTAEVMTPVLGGADGADGAAEVWRVAGPVHSGQRGRVRYRHNGRLLFASLSVPESEFHHGSAGGTADALRAATEAGYREMFAALESLGFPHPLRIWNFLPEINGAIGEGERYWHFNGARQQAFIGRRRAIRGDVPAASAVGAEPDSPVTIYCIAGQHSPIPLENPRQRSAWDYPPQYGPKSPTFARACLESDGARTLFISGTASIVGHETAHAGDARAQTRETLRNIRALIDAANERIGDERHSLGQLRYKVYVRRAEHQPMIEQELRREVGAAAPVLYLQADICRRDLLVEIEAVGP
jgi:enamine deaminase RidA (YjgF/YER057c/UK114 family)